MFNNEIKFLLKMRYPYYDIETYDEFEMRGRFLLDCKLVVYGRYSVHSPDVPDLYVYGAHRGQEAIARLAFFQEDQIRILCQRQLPTVEKFKKDVLDIARIICKGESFDH